MYFFFFSPGSCIPWCLDMFPDENSADITLTYNGGHCGDPLSWSFCSWTFPGVSRLGSGGRGWVSLLYKKAFSLFAFIEFAVFGRNYLDFRGKIIVSRELFCLWFCSNSWLWAGGNNHLVCNINELVFIAYMICKAVPTGPPCQRLCTSAVLEIKYFGVRALSVCFLICWGWGGYHCYIRRPSHCLHL